MCIMPQWSVKEFLKTGVGGISLFLTLVIPAPLLAEPVTIPHTFQANTPARASEVSANFNALATATNDNDRRIAALEAMVATLQTQVTTQQAMIQTLQTQVGALQATDPSLQGQVTGLQTQVATLQANPVLMLAPYVQVEPDELNGLAGPHVVFAGVNVHIQNGVGETYDPALNEEGALQRPNGRGNLVIGYNEVPLPPSTLQPEDRGGSHNLILGPHHKYASVGGLVAGFANSILGLSDSVSGGQFSTAIGRAASVSGGSGNMASGHVNSVSGGTNNMAQGDGTSISGGSGNRTSANAASVSGGRNNIASESDASVSGGTLNTASGDRTSVSGGAVNTASGSAASVSGGEFNTASGNEASVSGGANRTASRAAGWVAGTLSEQ